MTAVNLNDLKVIKGQDKIKTYQFNTNVAKHYFCSTCGVYTHMRIHMRKLIGSRGALALASAGFGKILPITAQDLACLSPLDVPCEYMSLR